MATIKQIDRSAVHQIQSGQVIVDLCSVVKELVENSLDAGATSIDVRFKSNGLDSIEVQDNGDGISSSNYETIALKHYTSKLLTYSDLATLQTFGFRGEALSSLCALSNCSIITCIAADAPKGTKLEFDVSGRLRGKSIVAAQKGTTVVVENLFNNLPVRRRELERNIKREWGKVVGILGQYACIQTGVKFSVTQQPAKGKKTTIFSTKGNQSTRENIVNVFGAKTLTALVPLDLNLLLEPTSASNQHRSIQEDGGKKDIRIIGHISRPASGEGRQTPDRQMFFVNARPCGLPQVAKAFNEVYKSYNASQSPFIFANIELDTHLYDVNVSPDKRTILLHDQSRMLDTLKDALVEVFELQDYTVPISQLPAQKQPSFKQLTLSRESTIRTQPPLTLKEPLSDRKSGHDEETSPGHLETVALDKDEPRSRKRRNSHNQNEEGSARRSLSQDSGSRNSTNRDTAAVRLLSDCLGSKAETRANSKAQPLAKESKGSDSLSKDRQSPVEKFRKGSIFPLVVDTDTTSPVNSAIASQFAFAPRSSRAEAPEDFVEKATTRMGTESPIAVLRSPSKPPLAVLTTIAPARLQQVSPKIATITIGDQTVISSIGTPCPNRPEKDDTGISYSKGDTSGKRTSSFGNLLNQRFVAPGVTQHSTIGEVGSEDQGGYPEALTQREEFAGAETSIGEEEGTPPSPLMATVAETIEEQGIEPSLPIPEIGGDDDDEHIDEDSKKAREELKVQDMIKAAEAAIQPSQENIVRATSLLKGAKKKKDSTLNLKQIVETNCSKISELFAQERMLDSYTQSKSALKAEKAALDTETAEEKLSLTISKADFANMKIIGQFNLGFILASRTVEPGNDDGISPGDELFIIDQHASDEKYNFERLQATTIVQSQKLVHPKILELTAVEEEIVIEKMAVLEANGFVVKVDESGDIPVGQRCQLISLPISRETTFSIADLEELLALLVDNSASTVPRPSRVRKMFAMRACRSSIMIGKTLTQKQMGKVVKHLGELDKPWNCPHGRPTMRHLCGLGVWDDIGWKEGDTMDGERPHANWAAYVGQDKHVDDDIEDEDIE
ncbi:hypothetical protein B0O99DRAFT_88508 [Bisporella sp. PMI_857]|nr:hypothetical protein B0O99DRAFT_88508 [Bisporella sp. PMI_857]